MLTRTMPMIEARNRLTKLPEQFRRNRHTGAVVVTRRGKPVLAVLPWELYESIVETLEILGDEGLMTAVRRGIKEYKEGKGIPWEEAKKQLSL